MVNVKNKSIQELQDLAMEIIRKEGLELPSRVNNTSISKNENGEIVISNWESVISETTKQDLVEIAKELVELVVFMTIRVEPFFANVIMQLNREYVFDFPAAAGVTIRRAQAFLYINPIRFMGLLNNVDEMIAVLKHECYHILNLHIIRASYIKKAHQHHRVNISMDCSINQFIKNLPSWTISLDYIAKKLKEYNVNVRLEKEREFEYYLDLLEQAASNSKNLSKEEQQEKDKEEQEKDSKNKQQEREKEEKKEGTGQKGRQHQEDSKLGKIERETNVILQDKDGDGHEGWDGINESELETAKEMIKNMANNAMQKTRGEIPAEIREMINMLNKPPQIKWQDEAKKMAGSLPTPYKKSFLRRDRRQPDRTDIKGRMMDRKPEITVAIDTSGSMSKDDMEVAFTEVFAIARIINARIRIIECDAQIGKVYYANSAKDVQLEITGRGGTCFQPVFEYLKNPRNHTDLLIYFTDGGGEWEIDSKFLPRGYQVLWVLTNDNYTLSLRKPFGRIRNLKFVK